MSKLLATIRYRAWPNIKAKLANEKKSALTENELLAIIDEVDPEDFRAELLELFNIKVPANETPKKLMQKAFVQYATKIPDEDLGKHKNPFLEMIHFEQKTHFELVEKMGKGVLLPGIDKNPLSSTDPDYTVEYAGMDGYMKRE